MITDNLTGMYKVVDKDDYKKALKEERYNEYLMVDRYLNKLSMKLK